MPEILFAGEYYLEGMREMASGFLIRSDGTFEFFFTYGALDRYGSGTWNENNGVLTFQSKSKPSFDYALLQSHQLSHGFTSVRIKDNNPVILQYVYVSLDNGKEGSWNKMDKTGEARLPKQSIETISLLFEFCPERTSTFIIEDPALNDFEFRFEPWLFEFFFEGFTLMVTEDALFGKHPLMEGDQFQYRRSPGGANS